MVSGVTPALASSTAAEGGVAASSLYSLAGRPAGGFVRTTMGTEGSIAASSAAANLSPSLA